MNGQEGRRGHAIIIQAGPGGVPGRSGMQPGTALATRMRCSNWTLTPDEGLTVLNLSKHAVAPFALCCVVPLAEDPDVAVIVTESCA